MVLGGFLLEEEKQPAYCKISRKADVIKLVPTRLAHTHRGAVAHLSLLLIRCSEMWQLLLWSFGRSSMSHRCFQRTRYSSGETVITLQLQIKISSEACNTKYTTKKVQSRVSYSKRPFQRQWQSCKDSYFEWLTLQQSIERVRKMSSWNKGKSGRQVENEPFRWDIKYGRVLRVLQKCQKPIMWSVLTVEEMRNYFFVFESFGLMKWISFIQHKEVKTLNAYFKGNPWRDVESTFMGNILWLWELIIVRTREGKGI